MADGAVKSIKILAGSVSRLVKDVKLYKQECVDEAAKLEKMISQGEDPYTVRQQEQVLQESRMMIPDTLRRLQETTEDLEQHIEGEADNEKVANHDDYKAAKEVLEKAQEFLTSN
eukprot:c8418_g1_i1.p3 GENE.c8418_g1_i1~~c8418_g1_i1.p3  ORF type:complete len:115 (-),score=23.24 c8418_g1_i1:181-525(-)